MLSNKRIRCHILDRTDQLASAKEQLKYLKGRTLKQLQAIHGAELALEKHSTNIANAEKFVKDLEATMHIHWLENPPY